jgi:hypothetical protein
MASQHCCRDRPRLQRNQCTPTPLQRCIDLQRKQCNQSPLQCCIHLRRKQCKTSPLHRCIDLPRKECKVWMLVNRHQRSLLRIERTLSS